MDYHCQGDAFSSKYVKSKRLVQHFNNVPKIEFNPVLNTNKKSHR